MLKKDLFKAMFCTVLFVITSYISVNAQSRLPCISSVINMSSLKDSTANYAVLDNYTDIDDSVTGMYKTNLCIAIENGIVDGFEDNTLRLDEEITRAQYACMLYRAREYFDTPISRIEYKGHYNDLSDWNKDAVYYVIENGLMMGYGDSFGCDDTVTSDQINTIKHRLKYGLTTREKYSLFDVCGNGLFSMNAILASAYNPDLTVTELPKDVYEAPASDKIVKSLEDILEWQGNIDYTKLSNEEYKEYISSRFKRQYAPSYYTHINIHSKDNCYNDKGVYTIDEMIEDAFTNNIIRESIFVISPTNNKEIAYGPVYHSNIGTGYEYYCYRSSLRELPNGEELNTWYRRTIIAKHTGYKPTHNYEDLYIEYGEPEKLEY